MEFMNEIDERTNDIFGLHRKYFGEEEARELESEYARKREDSLLQVMLFGSYNAGKSLLVNALLGKDVAAIGDVPETAEPASYEWKGVRLLDTPGVNAPIEHEQITEKQIDRSELMLFVIREGGQDVKDVYDRMFEMIRRDKKLFIIFNHELDAEQLPQALDKLNQAMLSYCESGETDPQSLFSIPVIPVNVRTARRAAEKGSDALAAHSGIVDFEQVFLAWLKRYDSDEGYLDRIKKYVKQCAVEPLEQRLFNAEEKSDAEATVTELQYRRQTMVRQYAYLESKTANFVRRQIVLAKPEIASSIDSAGSQHEVTAAVQNVAERIAGEASEFLRRECDEITAELEAAVDAPERVLEGAGEPSRMARTMEDLAVQGMRGADAEALKGVLLKLRELKVPFIKGRWEKTLGRWAGRAAWAVTAATTAYEIWRASSEESRKNKEMEQQALGLHQYVEDVSASVEGAILEQLSAAIDAIRDQSLAGVDRDIEQWSAQMDERAADFELVRRLYDEIQSVRVA